MRTQLLFKDNLFFSGSMSWSDLIMRMRSPHTESFLQQYYNFFEVLHSCTVTIFSARTLLTNCFIQTHVDLLLPILYYWPVTYGNSCRLPVCSESLIFTWLHICFDNKFAQEGDLDYWTQFKTPCTEQFPAESHSQFCEMSLTCIYFGGQLTPKL